MFERYLGAGSGRSPIVMAAAASAVVQVVVAVVVLVLQLRIEKLPPPPVVCYFGAHELHVSNFDRRIEYPCDTCYGFGPLPGDSCLVPPLLVAIRRLPGCGEARWVSPN